jgi:hypothetical protein
MKRKKGQRNSVLDVFLSFILPCMSQNFDFTAEAAAERNPNSVTASPAFPLIPLLEETILRKNDHSRLSG